MTYVVPATADQMDRVCVYCHTPHHATKDDLNVDDYPLWNHELVDKSTYTPYSWATPANDVLALQIVDPLIGPSRLCMSCHDGAIAIDQHGDSFGNTKGQYHSALGGGGTTVGLRARLTNDLTTTHPIGFDYLQARTIRNNGAGTADPITGDSEIIDPTYGFATDIVVTPDAFANQGVYNAVTRNQGVGSKLIQDVLYQGNMMTCASCHEVHNKENATQEAFNGLHGSNPALAPNYFLWAKESKSLICLSCHVK
jgi:hypothetical protein